MISLSSLSAKTTHIPNDRAMRFLVFTLAAICLFALVSAQGYQDKDYTGDVEVTKGTVIWVEVNYSRIAFAIFRPFSETRSVKFGEFFRFCIMVYFCQKKTIHKFVKILWFVYFLLFLLLRAHFASDRSLLKVESAVSFGIGKYHTNTTAHPTSIRTVVLAVITG